MKYHAIRSEENGDNISMFIRELETDELPSGDVLIKVHYSSLNYKDALSATGHRGVTKKYPHTPGIDAAGVVIESSTQEFKPGEKVLVTGYDLGMNTAGGFGGYIRVPAGWVVPIPGELSCRDSMILGTAGFTAGLSLYKLEMNGLSASDTGVLVTGASGGVGSLSVAILKKAGYKVTALTGKAEAYDFLKSLGADEIISRDELLGEMSKGLSKGRWDAAIDTVGGRVLSNLIPSIKMFGSVAVCGLTNANTFECTVYPFIIRGVNILGINSAETPMTLRKEIWNKLSVMWRPVLPVNYEKERSLDEFIPEIYKILSGGQTGRVILKHE